MYFYYCRQIYLVNHIFCNANLKRIWPVHTNLRQCLCNRQKVIVTKWSPNIWRISLYCKLFLERGLCFPCAHLRNLWPFHMQNWLRKYSEISWQISCTFKIREFTTWANKIRCVLANFQIPCVYPDREISGPFFLYCPCAVGTLSEQHNTNIQDMIFCHLFQKNNIHLIWQFSLWCNLYKILPSVEARTRKNLFYIQRNEIDSCRNGDPTGQLQELREPASRPPSHTPCSHIAPFRQDRWLCSHINSTFSLQCMGFSCF